MAIQHVSVSQLSADAVARTKAIVREEIKAKLKDLTLTTEQRQALLAKLATLA